MRDIPQHALPPILRALLGSIPLPHARQKGPGPGAKRAAKRLANKRKTEDARAHPPLSVTRQQIRQHWRADSKAALSRLKHQARHEKRKGGSAPIKQLERAS